MYALLIRFQSKMTASVLALLILLTMTTLSIPANAIHPYGHDNGHRNNNAHHSIAKNALVGAGAGAAIGAITGRHGERGSHMVKGALIGGAAGGTYGYLRKKGYFHRNTQPHHD